MKREKEVRLIKLDWNRECEKDFIIGKGFEITEPAFKGKEQKSLYGTHSPLFATDWEDEDAFTERYACNCKELRGRVYEDEICPVCRTRVKFRDVDLKITGWIKFSSHLVIQPIFYRMLKSIIGDTAFKEIIEFDKEITRNGIVINKKSKNPFKGIGLIEFHERFEEILDYYREKKKNKIEMIDEVLREKQKVFSSCVPVYSSVLRPVSFKGETYFYNSIDRKYNSIYSLSRLLNNKSLMDIKIKSFSKKDRNMDEPTILQKVQVKLMELWDLIFQQINQKDGHRLMCPCIVICNKKASLIAGSPC